MKPTVFIPDPIAATGMEMLRVTCDCVAPWASGAKPSGAELKAMLPDADAVIVRLFQVRGDDLARAVNLKVIAKHGVGVDNIDVPAATARRIPVVFTPTANANAVAEHTMALILALARNLYPAAAAMAAGRFADRTKFDGVELEGKTLGVVGFGRIGRRVANMALHGFGMTVRVYDPFITPGSGTKGVAIEESLEDLLRAADFLTLHMPLTPETRHLINGERLAMLKPACRIVNTSRGGVIDDQALAEALRGGKIAGAGLDVFDQEPLPAGHPFYETPNTLLTPHISSSTKESLDRMARDAAQGVLDVLQGRKPAFPVNPEVLK